MRKKNLAILIAIIVLVMLILGSVFGDGYDFLSDLVLFLVFGFIFITYKVIKGVVTKDGHVAVTEETYNKSFQERDLADLKKIGSNVGKKVGLGCLVITLGFLVLSLVLAVLLGLMLG